MCASRYYFGGIGILRTNRYNVLCSWGVAKRQGSGLWIRHRWFESIHPSQIRNRMGKPGGFLVCCFCVFTKGMFHSKGVLCAKMKDKSQSLGVLILAAGKGTRMYSNKPKVLESLLEEPVIYYPVEAARIAGFANIAVLVGYQGEQVESYVSNEWPDVEVVWQREQLGTGHAVKMASEWWKQFDDVMVLNGDVPLVRPQTIADLYEKHVKMRLQCTFMSFMLENPSGYGRVARLADGGVRIIEDKDAVDEERLINEINAGVYVFNRDALAEVIDSLGRNNEQDEYYLTDTIPLIGETEGRVDVVLCEDPCELLGINTPMDLAMTADALNKRIVREHMSNGLKCMDPSTTWIGPRVEIASDVFFEPGVQVWGETKIASGVRVGAHSTLNNVRIGAGTVVFGPSVLADASIGINAEVGPFAFLRGGVEMSDFSKVGRFVEIKKSAIGEKTKVPHLSYIGDTTIGANTNIGAGTVTCNYDGSAKHRTTIGEGCFVGSDTMFVAPVEMGNNASTAAGSIVTKDIPDGALGIARARQTNIDNWYERKSVEKNNKKDSKES